MDIDLLSKMVKELILDSDEVSLPGLGTFLAELVPSTFSDKGYTINPPYRRLVFRQRRDESDTALINFYASSNNVETDSARRIIVDFIKELRQELQDKKLVVFPGLGRLRATRENNFFFIANEDLDIYPAGFGLEPISLKTHEETEDEISEAVAGLGAYIDFPMPTLELAEDAPEPDAVPKEEATPKEEAAPKEEDVPKEEIITEESTAESALSEEVVAETTIAIEKGGGMKKKILVLLLVLLAVAIVLFALFMLLAKFAPSSLDHLLYTKEQLEILNYEL